MKAIIQYIVFSLVGLLLLFLTSFVVDRGIREVENMLVPCQHGTTYSQGMCRCENTPFNGTYCSNCMCANGACSTDPTHHFTSDYGCRCPTMTKWFGFLCDECRTNTSDCKGECMEEYFGPRCNKRCYANLMTGNNNSECSLLKSEGGTCNACNGHGTCDMGECKCDTNYFNRGEEQCAQTCPELNGAMCSGHGLCKLFGERAGCLCEKGWFGIACDIACPGVQTTGNVCNNRGVCEVDYAERSASCNCKEKFRGEDCSIECPGDVISCNGHGTCDNAGVCTCETNVDWSQPSCRCSPELTCNGKGNCVNEKCLCFGNFGGENCLECNPHWFGENCDLYCDPYLEKSESDKVENGFGCYGHGSCMVKEDHMECTCNLNTAGDLTINGATKYYKSFYDHTINCADCESDYFPKQSAFNSDYFAVACQEACTSLKCNNRGTCNPDYTGELGSHICNCDLPRVDPEARCASCIDNWFPEERCDKFCIASGSLPDECDGTMECVQCNGHGTCSEDGDCRCTDGYTGDQCHINCNNDQGHECGGHGKCVSSKAQQLLQFDIEQNGGSLFNCQCDPQDLYDNARDTNETVVERPRPDFFGETCDHSCVKPPWKDANECNGMGNCTITLIQAPNAATFDCLTDADCKTDVDLTNILSGEVLWSDVKGPFCFSAIDEQPLGCQRSKEDCYDIILHQRPKGMRTEECSTCLNDIENTDWHAYCENVNEHVQPDLFRGCNSIESFCPVKSIPAECKTMVDLTDGSNVSSKLNYHYEYDKRKYPFKIGEDYRTKDHSILHDEAESEFKNIDIEFEIPNSFCPEHGQRFPSVTSVRENKQYLCNGAIQNTTVCTGVLEESNNNLYFPFQVVCSNGVTSYETYKEAVEVRSPGCKLEEVQNEHVLVEEDGTKEIIETCDSIKIMFPKCTYPSPCDFNPCSEGYRCTNYESKALCTHETGDFVSSCNKGVFKQLKYTEYQCTIDIPDTSCPRDITFKTNVFQHCIDHNPSTSASEASFVTFEFKAPDPIGFSKIDFGDVSVYIVQGQVQLMEPNTLQSCPIDNPTCTETWRYEADIWYTIELELNGTHVFMRNNKGEATAAYAQTFNLSKTEGQTTFRNIRFEKNIPSPYSCSYETCDMDVSYRKICSDIIHNVEYPSLLEPKHDILQVCSSMESKQQIPITLDYNEMKEVQELNWDTYCDFYNAFEESTVSATYQDLEVYTTCQQFVDPLDGNKTCIDNALDHDWSAECESIHHAKLPDSITEVCPAQCYNKLLKDKSCKTRKEWFVSNKEVIETDQCSIDWYDTCVKDTKGMLPGKCAAVECDCNKQDNLGITGDSCQLHCPIGFDGTACSEDSGLGKCMYTGEQLQHINMYGDYNNAWALTGECHCARQDGDGACDVECRDCNKELYPGGQIGICDNTRGTCKCLPPFTVINSIDRMNWKGETVTTIEHEFNDGNLEGDELYRVRMIQGRESFVKNALQFALENRVVDLQVVSSPPEWGSDLTLCKNILYTFNMPAGHNMVLVQKEDCEFLGCEDGRYISMPNYIAKFEGSGNYTFGSSGEFYYLCEFHDTMVSKIIVQSCSGDSVYNGIVPWETIYRDFIKFPDKYWCFNRICESYDITMLGNLEDTSYRYNYDCNLQCPGFNEITQIGCSGHGRCGVNGQCMCDPAIISNAVLTVYERNGEEVISTAQVSNSLDTTGYRGDRCQIVCPGFDEETGDMSSICNGHGTCDLGGQCACEIGYTGDECQFSCPVVDGSICTGHGTCEMAEISVSFNTYNGFSDQCEYFSGMGHCKAYATLYELNFIDIASTTIVGENKHCSPITEEECRMWTEYQDTNYIYLGEQSVSNLPFGCFFTTSKKVYFNNIRGVECGSINTLCVCRSDTPDITFCSQDNNTLILHTKGGSEYLKLGGLYTYEKISPYTSLEEAKQNCNDCLAIQRDPPVGDTYYVINFSNDLRLIYNKPYTELETECLNPVKISSIYSQMDEEEAILTCMKFCEIDGTCNSFKIEGSSCLKCQSYVFKFDGGCNSVQLRVYDGDGDNPCTGDNSDCIERCANACVERRTPTHSTWEWIDEQGGITGFSVAPPAGRCYCEHEDSDTCSRMGYGYKRYDISLPQQGQSQNFYIKMVSYPTDIRSVNKSVCEIITNAMDSEYSETESSDLPHGCVYTATMSVFNDMTTSIPPSNDFKLIIDTVYYPDELLYRQNHGTRALEKLLSGNYTQIKSISWAVDISHTHLSNKYMSSQSSCDSYCRSNDQRYTSFLSSASEVLDYFSSVTGTYGKVIKYPDYIVEESTSYYYASCKRVCGSSQRYCSRSSYYRSSGWGSSGGTYYQFRCKYNWSPLTAADYESAPSGHYSAQVYTTLKIAPLCLCSNIDRFMLAYGDASTGVYDQAIDNPVYVDVDDCRNYGLDTNREFTVHSTRSDPAGCYIKNDQLFYNECDNCPDASSEKELIVKTRLNSFITLDGINDLSLSQIYCEAYAISNKHLYIVTHESSVPKGCSMVSSTVFYNTDGSSNEICGNYWCIQHGYDDIGQYSNIESTKHYIQNELVSGEKYTNYLKTPSSLCITEEALVVEAGTQAPIISALQANNEVCHFRKIEGLCSTILAEKDCQKYVDSLSYIEFTSGAGDRSLTEAECREHFGNLFDSAGSWSETPTGCYLFDGTDAHYNNHENDIDCQTGTSKSRLCVKKPQMTKLFSGTKPTGCSEQNGDYFFTTLVTEYEKMYDGQCTGGHTRRTEGDGSVENCFQVCKTSIGFLTNGQSCWCSSQDINTCTKVSNSLDRYDIRGNCSFNTKCICNSGRYMDKSSGRCQEIEDEPIIEVTLKQDRNTEDEIEYTVDCQVISNSSVQCTQCNCFGDLTYGYWGGTTCSTCSIGYGRSQCNEICPTYDGENKKSMCNGLGKCLFGSEKLTVERVFQRANCVCGQDDEYQAKLKTDIPDSKYSDVIGSYSWYEPITDSKSYPDLDFAKVQCDRYNDISLANINGFCYGVFKRDNKANTKYEIHIGNVGTEFIQYGLYYKKELIPAQTVSYNLKKMDLQTKIESSTPEVCKDELTIVKDGFDTCNHFNLKSETCNECEDTWTGKNCRNKCQKCLARGSCDTTPDEQSISKCVCRTDDLWEHQCCPAGFMVTDLVKWQSIPQRKIDQIKLQSFYDPFTTNMLDSSFFCKKCPGVLNSEWLDPNAIFKVCSGEARGECIVNSETLNAVCKCQLNELSGTTWKGRACSCDDSLDEPYNTNPELAETTDYGCLIPTNGQAICPEANPVSSNALSFYPYMLYALGRSIEENYPLGDKFLGPFERLSSPLTWTGGVAFEIAVTDGPHGKCDDETPCHTGEGPCISDSDCAGGLLCNTRIGSDSIKQGYDTSKKNMFYRYCYDPIETLIGCDPIPTFREFDGSINFYNYKYWDGSSFSLASANHYVPMSKDANNNMIIHKRQFPCPKGKYGVVWDGLNECALCPQGKYQDETAQSSCKTPCLGTLVGVTDPNHCVECYEGETPLEDGTACEVCPNGKYEENSICLDCPQDTYQLSGVNKQSGVDSCIPCPAGSSTESTIAFIDNTGTGTCLSCKAGTYGKRAGEGCQACPVGKYSTDEILSFGLFGYTDDSVSKEDCEAFALLENKQFEETNDYGFSVGCSNYLLSNIVYWNNVDINQECLYCIKKQNYYFADKPTDYVLDKYVSPLNENECRTIDSAKWGGVASGGLRGCYLDLLLDKIYFNREIGECSDTVPGKTCIQRVRSGSWVTEHTGIRLVEYTPYVDWINPLYNKKPTSEYNTQISCLTECETLCARFHHLSCHQESSVFKCMCSNNGLSTTSDSTGVVKSRLPDEITNCLNCKKGTFTLNGEQAYCEFCAVGKYKDQSSDRECKECSSGQYQNDIGMLNCKDCEAGKYQNDKGKTSCKCCPTGQYNSASGRTSCERGNGKGQFLHPLGGQDDFCTVPNKYTCATGLTGQGISYHLEIRGRETVGWSGSERYGGYYSNAQSCANRCYDLEPTWRGFIWKSSYKECWCESEGGVMAIKRCWYEGDSNYNMYSILRCPMISGGRQYFDKISYNTCRL
jgi:hypothetical protein